MDTSGVHLKYGALKQRYAGFQRQASTIGTCGLACFASNIHSYDSDPIGRC